MNKTWRTVCAIGSTLLLLIGFILIFVFAWVDGFESTLLCVCGLFVGFVFAPIIHELGHIYFAKKTDMAIMYAKAFCFAYQQKDGKKKLTFASPFADDQTQAIPINGGNMYHRAIKYTLGGLYFGGIFLAAVLLVAIVLSCFRINSYFVWGIVPYVAYLELLNLLPVEYAKGKTDMLIYTGIKHGDDVEAVMLSAMEIQGQLYEGKSFSEIDEELFFKLPQICEDEPLFAIILDLRYRYYLEKGDIDGAADCLNRLLDAQAYISNLEFSKIAIEFVYIYSIIGNVELAQESSQDCKEQLSGDMVAAKRALSAFSLAAGDLEAAQILLKHAKTILQTEPIEGIKKAESILLSRLDKACERKA